MKLFLLLAIVVLATVATAQDQIQQDIYFHQMPERYMPYVSNSGLKVRGDCKTGFSIQSKFEIRIPNPEKCSLMGLSKPLVATPSFRNAGATVVEVSPAECVSDECKQVVSIKISNVQCSSDPLEASDVHEESVAFAADFGGKCGNINRNLGKVGARVPLQLSDVLLSKASRFPHVESKRSIDVSNHLRARATPLGGPCMADSDCNCDLFCNTTSGVCEQLAQNAWRNATCNALNPPGTPPCVTYYCNPADADAYNSTLAALGCAAIYEDALTPCTFVTEPGAAYGPGAGVCQGGYEGMCFSNNQAQFRISDSSTTTLPKTDDTDNFHADSSDYGHFVEGGFPLWAGTSVDKPIKRLVGLPLEDEQAITPPWVHKDDEDTVVGLIPDYPINPGLVDDDDANHDTVLNTIRTTGIANGWVNCNLTLLLDENGYGIDYCSGQANTTVGNAVLLNGVYFTPRSHEFIYREDDDDTGAEDDGGDLEHVRLKKKGKYCSPVCYCAPVTFDGVNKYQIVQCTRGFFPVAGDAGDKDARWRAEVGIFVPGSWIILMVIGYWWLGTYSGLARQMFGARVDIEANL